MKGSLRATAMDQVTICNLALSKLGEQSITSLDDGSLEARFCSLHYPVVLQQILLLNNWNFATKQAQLTQLSSTPLFGWSYAYQLPADYSRMNQFNGFNLGDSLHSYEIQGNTLLTNDDQAQITYISNSPDQSLFTPGFCRAFVLLLASELCKPLAGTENLKTALLAEFKTTMSAASQIDSNDERPARFNYIANSSLVQARFVQPIP